MEKVHIALGQDSYDIVIGRNLKTAELMQQALPKTKDVMIVTNTTVGPLYLAKVEKELKEAGFTCFSCILKDGEAYKTVESYMQIMTALMEAGVGRDCVVVALGGGVVGDMAGFAAATYQRGVAFVQIPTTLLALVDSSVGGKTAINHPLGKNMIGAFHQPKLVIADLAYLKTLPPREIAAGMAEVVKYAVIFDEKFFEYLRTHNAPFDFGYIIKRCCEWKAKIVAEDEKEHGQRALLNYGHTFGHAIETGLGFGTYLHGEGVAVGMVMAARVAAVKLGFPKASVKALRDLLVKIHLPVDIPSELSAEDFITYMHHDKKVRMGSIVYVLPERIGSAKVVKDLKDSEVQALVQKMKEDSL